MPDTPERWRPVAGYEGAYEVSDLGRVRSLDRVVVRADGRTKTVRARVLKPGTNTHGYATVHLCAEGRPRTLAVHRLVALAFLGAPPVPSHVVNHLDGIKANNRAANLEWATAAENNRHAFRTGLSTPSRGEASAHARLSDDAVREARAAYAAGEGSLRSLGRRFGVSHTTLRYALGGLTWRHVGPSPSTQPA